MARRIIGLDLGAYSVKMLRLEAGKQVPRFEVVDTFEEVLPPDQVDGPDLLERQLEALRRFSTNSLLDAETYIVGLPAADGQMRTMLVPFSDLRKIEAVLPGLMEAEVPFDLSEMSMAWHRQEGQTLAKSAEGEDNSLIRVAFGKKQSIAAILGMLQNVGLDPRLMHLASSAPYELIRELGYAPFSEEVTKLGGPHLSGPSAGTIIDFGHRATNLCIFDQTGLKFAVSFLRGGKKLTEDIAKAFDISFSEAEALKHEKLSFEYEAKDELDQKLVHIARAHYADLAAQIARIFVTSSASGYGVVNSVGFIGGGAKVPGLSNFYDSLLSDIGCRVVSLNDLIPARVPMPSMGLAFAYALSGLHIHSKDSRFNFRKDEFAWRGELDFLRQNSSSIFLWCLGIVCSLVLLFATNSMVLNKENKVLEEKLKTTCSSILGQANLSPQRCLAQMKEQISSRDELGIPEFTAADVYLKTAEAIPADVNIVVSEMDISEKKMRMSAESSTFADIDKVVASLSKVPCFKKIENARAQTSTKGVRYNLSNDIDCSLSVPSSTPAPTPASPKSQEKPQ